MLIKYLVLIAVIFTSFEASALLGNSKGSCKPVNDLGSDPKQLIVIVPATGHTSEHWKSFMDRLESDPNLPDSAILVYEHHINYWTLGSLKSFSEGLSACIDEKFSIRDYESVTLIGHSIGGMVARYSYLIGSGSEDIPEANKKPWASKVDRILLFASVNKGISHEKFAVKTVNWLWRSFPHPHFVLEDIQVGSSFVATTRIAWIRHFGRLVSTTDEGVKVPHVVQFWGSKDSYVNKSDNADLKAFTGADVVTFSGATHGNLIRFEPEFTDDPVARWGLVSSHLYGDISVHNPPTYQANRVLFIARGIRDSSMSDWVKTMESRAIESGNWDIVFPLEYGYFSAANFVMRPTRQKNIPMLRDKYAEYLAINPLTEFDYIGHSNGTYIFGHSLRTTPSMKFRNAVLAAPVLPTDFNWDKLFSQSQVKHVRYDSAAYDIPVGILCQALNALGFEDVGPSGFANFKTNHDNLDAVSWYGGGHGSALKYFDVNSPGSDDKVDNMQYLIEYAADGQTKEMGEPNAGKGEWLSFFSRITKFLIWLLVFGLAFLIYKACKAFGIVRSISIVLLSGFTVYALLDSI